MSPSTGTVTTTSTSPAWSVVSKVASSRHRRTGVIVAPLRILSASESHVATDETSRNPPLKSGHREHEVFAQARDEQWTNAVQERAPIPRLVEAQETRAHTQRPPRWPVHEVITTSLPHGRLSGVAFNDAVVRDAAASISAGAPPL